MAMMDNLIKIETDSNIEDNKDLSLLEKYIGDKEIIGLGEATHGTKEFQNMKTRIILYLVKNLGFRTIVLEESYSYCLRINSYILGGEGTAEEAVKEGLCFKWVFKTEETLALVKWLREYNISAGADSKVRFYGMDFQSAQKAIEVLEFYIKKVDMDSYNKTKTDLDFLKDEKNNIEFEELVNRTFAVDRIFIDNKAAYIRNNCEREYDEVYRCIENYRQWIDHNKNGNTFNLRDKFMFENVKWIFESSKKYNDGKMIISAHNDHIQKGTALNSAENRQLGYLLDDEYKDKYYNIGFEFSRGTFYSFDMNDDYKLKIFKVDKCIKNDLAARLFESTNIPMFFLDLKAAAQNSPDFLNFISNINRYNAIGAVYDNTKGDFGVDRLILKDMYDAILYIKDTSNTNPLSI